MKIIETFRSAIGSPDALLEISDGNRLVAAVGRWRHGGTQVKYLADGVAVFVFNVSGGQLVKRRTHEGSTVQAIDAGSIGTVAPGECMKVAVAGAADTITIFVTEELLEAVTGNLNASGTRPSESSERELQSAGARALVALARDDDESRVAMHGIVCDVASAFRRPGAPKRERGGLPIASLQRVRALIEERLEGDAVAPPRICELADAAGLSEYHFIRAFRCSEGRTPHAWVATRRLERALALILQGTDRVDEVGERLGFSSPSHFVGSFRKQFGVTPGSLRNAATPTRRGVSHLSQRAVL